MHINYSLGLVMMLNGVSLTFEKDEIALLLGWITFCCGIGLALFTKVVLINSTLSD